MTNLQSPTSPPLHPVFRDVAFALAAPSWGTLPPPGAPEIAFVGRSNVGKSSLLNALLERKALARTSRTPGKTRAFNFYALGDGEAFLVDLPGYGYAKVSQTERDRWARLIEQYVTQRPSLRLVLHLIDSRHEPTALDRTVLDAMRGSSVPYVVVLTKGDKLSGNGRAQRLKATHGLLATLGREVPVLVTSAEKRTGLDDVRGWMLRSAGIATPPAAP